MDLRQSAHVVENIARALELTNEERRQLYAAYTRLTGQQIDDQPPESVLLDFGELAHLLVHNTSYPAHSLDRLWFLHSWNVAAIMLFEVQQEIASNEKRHLLELVFEPRLRRHFGKTVRRFRRHPAELPATSFHLRPFAQTFVAIPLQPGLLGLQVFDAVAPQFAMLLLQVVQGCPLVAQRSLALLSLRSRTR